MSSYRDPNVLKTIETFENANVKRRRTTDSEILEEAHLRVQIHQRPLAPSSSGGSLFTGDMDDASRQTFRDRLLDCTGERARMREVLVNQTRGGCRRRAGKRRRRAPSRVRHPRRAGKRHRLTIFLFLFYHNKTQFSAYVPGVVFRTASSRLGFFLVLRVGIAGLFSEPSHRGGRVVGERLRSLEEQNAREESHLDHGVFPFRALDGFDSVRHAASDIVRTRINVC